MPAYRFSWDPFDDRTVLELARAIGYSDEPEEARAYLVHRVARPNDDFIRRTKDTLTRIWLPRHPSLAAAIVRDLLEMNIGRVDGCPRMQPVASSTFRAVETVRVCAICFLLALSASATLEEKKMKFGDEDFIPSFGILVPSKQTGDRRRPYRHQQAAWEKLDAHLREAGSKGVFKGVLVMPTGSGKTFTAAHWLTRRWIDGGNRVLWLAHREELLEQAARAFSACASLAVNRERLRLRQVSSRNSRFHQIDPTDDIVCCSVQSLTRAGAEAEQLLLDKRLFVVIDEAHHAPAKSYRRAIELLESAGAHRLLGLTATPTRTTENERPALRRLFGERVIYQVSMNELIANEEVSKIYDVLQSEIKNLLSLYSDPSATREAQESRNGN